MTPRLKNTGRDTYLTFLSVLILFKAEKSACVVVERSAASACLLTDDDRCVGLQSITSRADDKKWKFPIIACWPESGAAGVSQRISQ